MKSIFSGGAKIRARKRTMSNRLAVFFTIGKSIVSTNPDERDKYLGSVLCMKF